MAGRLPDEITTLNSYSLNQSVTSLGKLLFDWLLLPVICIADVTLPRLKAFIPQLLSRLHIEALLHGNIPKEVCLESLLIITYLSISQRFIVSSDPALQPARRRITLLKWRNDPFCDHQIIIMTSFSNSRRWTNWGVYVREQNWFSYISGKIYR